MAYEIRITPSAERRSIQRAVVATHPNAFRPWSSADEHRLARLWQNGATIQDLCAEFGRQPGGIRSRLQKLGLVDGLA